MKTTVLHPVFLLSILVSADAQLTTYFQQIGRYFGYDEPSDLQPKDLYTKRIPYEVSATDEKFIAEAAKLTDVALSDLDRCQHRVVLKLKKDCHKMSDEELAKMGVHLLNCQSHVEGRLIFPCTDEMSIKDCTTSMDSDTWTSYHLMSNRARAVCYTIRQAQFRGLAEQTVNKLMDSARNQLGHLERIEKSQQDIQKVAGETFEQVSKGHELIINQQHDIQRAQFHGQLTIEDNIQRLLAEKRLISDSHQELAGMTQKMQQKLEFAARQIETQSGLSKQNHQELLDDIVAIQNKAQVIFKRIEDSAELLLNQSELAKKHYEETLLQLAEVNKTVSGLIDLVSNTKNTLEEKLLWLSTSLGGTDLALERLYVIVWHLTLLLVAMIASAFLGAPVNVRFIVAGLPPVNLALALSKNENALGPINLIFVIVALSLAQVFITYLIKTYSDSKKPKLHLQYKPKTNSSPQMSTTEVEYEYQLKETSRNKFESTEDDDLFDNFENLTPPASNKSYPSRSRSRTPLLLNGALKKACKAKTRVGTPCKISSLPGRDFCYRHQSGDSVMLS